MRALPGAHRLTWNFLLIWQEFSLCSLSVQLIWLRLGCSVLPRRKILSLLARICRGGTCARPSRQIDSPVCVERGRAPTGGAPTDFFRHKKSMANLCVLRGREKKSLSAPSRSRLCFCNSWVWNVMRAARVSKLSVAHLPRLCGEVFFRCGYAAPGLLRSIGA
jgi:hypothetical protein